MIIVGFHKDVKERMEEMFKDQVCCVCGAPAGRLKSSEKRTDTKYFCYDCFTYLNPRRSPLELRPQKSARSELNRTERAHF
jgi:hypothetical protein